MKRMICNGSTLIELMIVIAIIALLSVISVTSFNYFLGKAKRSEAYMNLRSLYAAQKAYWAEHGTYSTNLNGKGGVGWKPDGYHGGGSGEKFYYTYGFSGGEGVNHFTGNLGTPAQTMGSTYADKDGFVALAVADLRGDGFYDVMSVDENNVITVVQDGL